MKKAKLDPYVFKSLDGTMKQEHKIMLGKHLIEVGYKLAKDKSGKTFTDVYDILNETIDQVMKLQNTYDKQDQNNKELF